MNENLNLCEILKDCPKGTKLWSPLCGDVILVRIDSANHFPIDLTAKVGLIYISLRSDGKMYDVKEAECLLFPSKDQRDWSKFKAPIKRFDPKEFKPFDKVLVRCRNATCWEATFFRCLIMQPIIGGIIDTSTISWPQCIPYNKDTSYLANTSEDCPDYYKWWKE